MRIGSLFVALFLSGAAALVYQTTWSRMLQRVFGVSDLAVATVLASFFLGLGLGAAIGGWLSQRSSRPALTYALLEFLIGGWALLSLGLIPNVHGLYALLNPDASFAWLTFLRLLIALVILLPPTLLMGATLPVLIKVVGQGGQDWSRSATALYATNTFGAMVGAGLTGLVFLPQLGNRLSVIVAAAASIGGGVLVWVLWRRAYSAVSGPVASMKDTATAAYRGYVPDAISDNSDSAEALRSRVRAAVLLAGVAGFASLSSEVLWTRVLRIVVQGTTNAFAAMLVTYLCGIALGSVIAERLQRTRLSKLRLFAITQFVAGVLTVAAMWLAPWLPRLIGLVQGQPSLDPGSTGTIFVLAAVLLLPIATTLGTGIPLAWAIVGGSPEKAPAHAGKVLASNTLGGLTGSLAAGFVMVPFLGLEGSLVFGVFTVHVVTALVALRLDATSHWEKLAAWLPALALLIVFVYRPSLHLPFLIHARADPTVAIIQGPSNFWKGRIAYLEEGRNTTVTVAKHETLLRLYNDGRPESGLSNTEPGFGPELATLGALPALYAKDRGQALVVGLGAGHTTTMLLAGGFAHIDVVELEEAVVNAARYIHSAADKPFPLDDPKTRLIIDDARARLVLSPPGTYDAVVSQPSHPWLAGSSALYTREFFHEVKLALREGGVFSLWVNLFRTDTEQLQRIVATLLDAFPHARAHVVDTSSLVLVAGREHLVSQKITRDRLATAALKGLLEPLALHDPLVFGATLELDTEGLTFFAKGQRPLTDDKPSLEFSSASLSPNASVQPKDLDLLTRELPWLSENTIRQYDLPDRTELFLSRLQECEGRPDALHRLALSIQAWPLSERRRGYAQGALEEAQGHVRTALHHYDQVPLRVSAQAADDLRLRERMYWRVLQTGLGRSLRPWSAASLLQASLAVASRDRAQQALAIAKEVDDPDDVALVKVVEAWVTGCPHLLEHPDTRGEAETREQVAAAAAICAVQEGRLDLFADYDELRIRSRRKEAQAAFQTGQAAGQGLRNAAAMWFRRALRANPAHGPAAAALAGLLSRGGRGEEAKQLLEEAHQAAKGLSASTAAIETEAMRLGITLSGVPEGISLDSNHSEAP